MYLRNSAKAMIIKDGNLLLLEKKGDETYIVFPGGGQKPEETLHETVIRECMEELGAEVQVGNLAFVREYREWNHEFAGQAPGFHMIDVIFRCSLISIDEALISEPDTNQVGGVWIPLTDLPRFPVYPKTVRTLFSDTDYTGPTYLGDVN